MHNSKYIPQSFKKHSALSRSLSEDAALNYVDRFNQGKVYGERIIESQIHTLSIIIKDYESKLRHKLTSGRRLHITVGNLANWCKCSLKTAHNHLKRLIDARILKKRFTTHKFKEKDTHETPCLELEINPQVLHFQVENIPVSVDKAVSSPQLELPLVPAKVLAELKQLGIWTDSV